MKRNLIFLIICLIISTISSGQDKNAEKLLRDAIYQEEVNGDLNDVIKMYESIVTKFPDNRAVAAKAQLHIGICYEKLGLKEATKAYDKVVNNYPDQKNMVTVARERLALLMTLAEKDLEIPLEPTFTKIKMSGNPGNGVLSPDGKKIAFISDGDVWIVPVSGGVDPNITGEPKRLTKNIGAWDMSNSFCWSGDGKWIAFNTKEDSNSPEASINIVDSEGDSVRKLPVPSHVCGWPQEFRLSLSPDGKTLAYTTGYKPGDWQNKFTQIFTIPVNGGDTKELTEQGTQEPSFSPDGSKIAYVKCYKDNNANYYYSNIWVIPSKGGIPVKVTNFQSGQAFGPVWSADGKMIAFLRRPEGQDPKEAWIIPVTDKGNPSGPLKRIDLPLSSFHAIAGWTAENKIGFQLTNQEYETIHTVPSSGGIATQVTPKGWTSYPKWSPDGKKIFFRWDGGKIATVPATGGVVDSISILSEFEMFTAVPGSGNEISPDGKTIVFSGAKIFYEEGVRKWDVNIYTIPAEGGKPTQLTEVAVELQDRFPCWSPDGNTIAFIRPEIKNGNHIMYIYTISKDGDNLTQITTESDGVVWAPIDWAPDGKSITYFSNDNSIKDIPVNGGESHLITKVDSVNSQFELAWSPDGKELAYTDKGKLWIYSPEEGATREVKTGVDARATKLGWSPDGKKIAFTAYFGGNSELWYMEDFLPLDKLAQEKEVLPKTTTLQKVISGETTIMWGAVSPNGRFLTYSDPVSLNLAYRDLSNGKSKLLTSDAQEEPIQFNMGSVVSPDSKQIAYAWYKNNHEIRLLDIDNPLPETLYGKIDEDVYPCAWSPDGKTIYAKSYLNKTRQCRILAITVSNGNVQVLKTFEGFYWLQLSVSPDNRYIAYHYPNVKNGETSDTDIHLISTDGKMETKLFEHPANDQILAWFPDKNQLLFKSDRSGSWDAWTIEIKNGKVFSDPVKVLSQIGANATQMGFTQKGTFYYSLFSRKFNGSILPFDSTNGELLNESAITLSGSVRDAKWSPNGKKVALIKELLVQGKRPLFIRDTESGNERMLSDRFILNNNLLLWLNDSKTLLLLGNDELKKDDKNYTGGMYTIDIQSGEVTELLAFSDYSDNSWEIGLMVAKKLAEGNNNQKSIYYLKKGQLISRELATGQEKILLTDNNFNSNNYTLDPLPGEKNLLFCNENQLFIIPVTEPKLIPVVKRVTINTITVENNAVWSPDGSYILYSHNMDDGSALWKVSVEGKNPKEVWKSKFPICSISIHPDGQIIVITTLGQGTEIWKVDNLLSNE